jgi:hypothetical protein
MQMTLQQSFAMFSTVASGWMMIRVGLSRHVLKEKVSHCASCGRRRGFGRCSCTVDKK